MNALKYITSSLKLKLLFGLLAIATIAAAPLMNTYAAAVNIEAVLGVANQTEGETSYSTSTNASFDDELVFQVYYHNKELPDSGLIAENLAIDVDIPTTAGRNQTVGVTVSGDNTNTENKTVQVNLDRDDAYLQFIPGSVIWRHNAGTNDAVNIVDSPITDASGNDVGNQILDGVVVENAQPCFNFDATVIFRARVIVPAIEVSKLVRVVGAEGDAGQFSRENTANPGDTLEYAIQYKNAGNEQQTNAIVRDNFPAGMNFVEGSVEVQNSNTNNQRVPYADDDGNYLGDDLIDDGINVGALVNPGAGANVYFRATIPTEETMPCAITTYRNVGVAFADGMDQHYNVAQTVVDNRDSETCVETTDEPVYGCSLLDPQRIGDENSKQYRFTATANDGDSRVEVETYRYNFGDGSDILVTDQDIVEHEYDREGVFVARVEVAFTVDQESVEAVTSNTCQVEINTNVDELPEEENPEELPSTGPGAIIATIAGTGVLTQGAHMYMHSRRKLAETLLTK